MQGLLDRLITDGVKLIRQREQGRREKVEQLASLGLQATATFPQLNVLDRLRADHKMYIRFGQNYEEWGRPLAHPSFALYTDDDTVVVSYDRRLSPEVTERMKEICLERAKSASTFDTLRQLVDGVYKNLSPTLLQGPTWLDSPQRKGRDYSLSDLAYAQEVLPKIEEVFRCDDITMLEKKYGFKLKPEVSYENLSEQRRTDLTYAINTKDQLRDEIDSESNVKMKRLDRTIEMLQEMLGHDVKDELKVFVSYVLNHSQN